MKIPVKRKVMESQIARILEICPGISIGYIVSSGARAGFANASKASEATVPARPVSSMQVIMQAGEEDWIRGRPSRG